MFISLCYSVLRRVLELAKHRDQERVRIELTLMGGAEHAREDLLGGGPALG